MASLTVTASAEVRRSVTVDVNAFGVPCGLNPEVNPDTKLWIWHDELVGGPITTLSNVNIPFKGHYRVCGYVGTGITDPRRLPSCPARTSGAEPRAAGSPPRRGVRSGRLKVTCANTDGPLRVIGRRGSRSFRTSIRSCPARASCPLTPSAFAAAPASRSPHPPTAGEPAGVWCECAGPGEAQDAFLGARRSVRTRRSHVTSKRSCRGVAWRGVAQQAAKAERPQSRRCARTACGALRPTLRRPTRDVSPRRTAPW